MLKKRPTIYDIARLAGVGVGTVSRVLNKHPNVNEETYQRVLKEIEEADYLPSFPARYIRTKRSQLFGLISDAVATTPFAVNLIKGAQVRARASGKLILMVDADGNAADRDKAVEVMIERSVEGLIYAAMFHQEVSLHERFHKLPTVLVDCYDHDRNLPSVVPDEVGGGRNATEHLLQRGHRRIAHIANDKLATGYPAPVGRLEGYKQALTAFDVPFDPKLVCEGDGAANSGYDHALELLQLPEPPTAIFCGTDRIAMGAYDAIKMRGLRIPQDIAVVGFDNQEVLAEFLRPPLSTVALPHYQMGGWAIDYLIRHLEGAPFEPVQHKIACPLITRESV